MLGGGGEGGLSHFKALKFTRALEEAAEHNYKVSCDPSFVIATKSLVATYLYNIVWEALKLSKILPNFFPKINQNQIDHQALCMDVEFLTLLSILMPWLF